MATSFLPHPVAALRRALPLSGTTNSTARARLDGSVPLLYVRTDANCSSPLIYRLALNHTGLKVALLGLTPSRNLTQRYRSGGMLQQNVRTQIREAGSGEMARRRKSGGVGGWAIGIVVVLFLISKIPAEVWVGLGVLAVIGLIVHFTNKSNRSAQAKSQSAAPVPTPAPRAAPQPLPAPPGRPIEQWAPLKPPSPVRAPEAVKPPVASAPAFRQPTSSIQTPVAPTPARPTPAQASAAPAAPRRDEEPVSVRPASPSTSGERTIPPAPSSVRVSAPAQSSKPLNGASWIPPGQSMTLAGAVIPGGLFYFGASLPARDGSPDPSLINPSLSVAATGDYRDHQLGYWPSYSQVSPSARRAYINWLAGRRSDRHADIGYVFVFFYGLERRAIIDASTDEKAKADLPAIGAEIQRLLDIYGGVSHSFRGYATSLLNWVTVARSERLYEQPVPELSQSFELPFYLRLAIGQAVKDGVPIPGHLALAWVKYGNIVSFRTAATRCPLEFDKLFLHAYAAEYGPGMPLSRNRTKLKLVYQPASAALRGYGELSMTFTETPDVSALKAPPKVLAAIVDKATNELDSFSRYVGKNPSTSKSLEAICHLPAHAWPDEHLKLLDAFAVRAAKEPSVSTFKDLLNVFGFKGTLTKDKMEALAQALASKSVGIEPDILAGAKHPKPEDHVVLFALEAVKETPRSTASYLIASLTLQLASAVAAADGDFSQNEADHLRDTVLTWKHLEPSQIQRLLACVHLLRAEPASLPALTKKLEPLDRPVKETIAHFMATVAQADGNVSPDEVRMLERIYKALGLDSQAVFSNVHAVASGSKPSTTAAMPSAPATPAKKGSVTATASGIKLDLDRVAALQKDTDRASTILAKIFTDEESPAAAAPPAPSVASEPREVEPISRTPAPARLLGLDDTHASLARLLLSRPSWTRAELEDAAADLDVMLDGALEHINEAAFDAHDMPFVEGDDPVTINPEFLEKVHA